MTKKPTKPVDIVKEEECDEEIITLVDPSGKEIDFHIVAELDYEEKWYVVLEPVEPIPELEEGEVLIYESVMTDDGEEIKEVEDEELVEAVFQEFLKMAEEDEE